MSTNASTLSAAMNSRRSLMGWQARATCTRVGVRGVGGGQILENV